MNSLFTRIIKKGYIFLCAALGRIILSEQFFILSLGRMLLTLQIIILSLGRMVLTLEFVILSLCFQPKCEQTGVFSWVWELNLFSAKAILKEIY